jgi:catechol 2,3-dioxygenase-like lactoylglutathione lyase family enzyme
MIDHTTINVTDLEGARNFYSKVLEPLGYKLASAEGDFLGYADGAGLSLGVVRRDPVGGAHVAFACDDHATVQAFHEAALEAGAVDNGPPGFRTHYHGNYYAAFVHDADGNNVEAVCQKPLLEELRPGLWSWTAPHPSWTPEEGGPEGWERYVRSYALDAGDSLVLFDPLAEVASVEELATGRPVVVVLTCRWHRRSSPELALRGATVYSPAEDAAEVGIPVVPYRVGDVLPGGVEPQIGGYPNEATLWIPKHAALVTGDVFLGGEKGFRVQPNSWLAEGLTAAALRELLRPLLDLPVELLLPTHGNPVVAKAHETLRRALSA